MPVTVKDSDSISTIHRAVRLQSELSEAGENVESMTLQIFFEIENQLPSGKIIGQPYWDLGNPLLLICKDDPELAEAMQIIQRKIGEGRYKQITASPEIPEPVETPGMLLSTEQT
jgi:hypothetical protein